MEAGGDERAPGAAITLELCASLDHPPPCPLAPHHTGAERDGDRVRLRILFAAEREREAEVRRRITAALTVGRVTGPDGVETRRRLERDGPARSARPKPIRPAA